MKDQSDDHRTMSERSYHGAASSGVLAGTTNSTHTVLTTSTHVLILMAGSTHWT